MISDPMGATPGRVLFNGNAETLDRFVNLAHTTLGASTHPDPVTREPLSFRRLPSGALSTTHPLLRIDAVEHL